MTIKIEYINDKKNNWIATDFSHGINFLIGHNCIIESDVVVGDNVSLGHNVMLKSGTRILNNVNLADRVHTTGLCIIGNNVMIRTGSCISKSVIIDDWVFIGAGIMSSHTKHIYHGREKMKKKQYITRYGFGCVIGSRCNSMAGISVAPGAIVGYGSNIVSNLNKVYGLYMGNPAKLVKVINNTNWAIPIPDVSKKVTVEKGYKKKPKRLKDINNYNPYTFSSELLKKYLPHYCYN